MGWMQITLILCMFGLLKEFRPSEPFVTDYLTGPWKKFNSTEVTRDIYPIATYSYLATLVLVFLVTDFVRYKPVIILCGLSGVATFAIMIMGSSLAAMQLLEFTYGLFMSTEVAYFTYIYAKVDKERYQAVSSYTRGSYLVGRFLSGLVAQITTSYDLLDYHQLNYLTLTGMSLATLWAFLLPPVKRSLYFNRSSESRCPDERSSTLRDSELGSNDPPVIPDVAETRERSTVRNKTRRAYVFLWRDFVRAYTNRHVVKWSLWWAFATCGYLQVLSYIQPLWQTAVEKDSKIYNGAVEAIYTIIGASAVFGIGRLRLNWTVLGEVTLSIFSIVEAAILLISSKCYNIWVLYAIYILFGVIYHTVITVASFEVAKNLTDDSYGLVFGINTLLALALQSLLTFVVVSGTVLDLDLRIQFQIYAVYYTLLGVVFMLMAAYTIIRFFRSGQMFSLWMSQENSGAVLQHEPVGISPRTKKPN